MRKTLRKRFLRRLLAGLMGSSGLSSNPGQRWTSILSRGRSNTPSRYMNSEFSFASYELVGFERLYFFPFKQEASHLHLVITPQGYIKKIFWRLAAVRWIYILVALISSYRPDSLIALGSSKVGRLSWSVLRQNYGIIGLGVCRLFRPKFVWFSHFQLMFSIDSLVHILL